MPDALLSNVTIWATLIVTLWWTLTGEFAHLSIETSFISIDKPLKLTVPS